MGLACLSGMMKDTVLVSSTIVTGKEMNNASVGMCRVVVELLEGQSASSYEVLKGCLLLPMLY